MDVLAPYLKGVWEAIQTVVITVWNVIKTVISTVINAILGTIKAVMQLITGDWSGAWNTIKNVATTVWNGIKSSITSIINGIRSSISSVMNGIKGTVTNIWNGIKSAIEGPINAAKEAVRKAIEAIKGFFNFKFKWPHIPLPRFSISGSANPLDWIKNGPPKLNVSWFAKGGILTKPTVFGMNGNTLMAGGEAGNEAVLPLNENTLGMIGRGIAEAMANNGSNKSNDATIERLISEIVKLASRPIHVTTQIDGRAVASSIAGDMSRELGWRQQKAERGLSL